MLLQAMVQRIEHGKRAQLTPSPRNPTRHSTGLTFADVAQSRSVLLGQTQNHKQQHARRILHNGPAPFYGSRKKAS